MRIAFGQQPHMYMSAINARSTHNATLSQAPAAFQARPTALGQDEVMFGIKKPSKGQVLPPLIALLLGLGSVGIPWAISSSGNPNQTGISAVDEAKVQYQILEKNGELSLARLDGAHVGDVNKMSCSVQPGPEDGQYLAGIGQNGDWQAYYKVVRGEDEYGPKVEVQRVSNNSIFMTLRGPADVLSKYTDDQFVFLGCTSLTSLSEQPPEE